MSLGLVQYDSSDEGESDEIDNDESTLIPIRKTIETSEVKKVTNYEKKCSKNVISEHEKNKTNDSNTKQLLTENVDIDALIEDDDDDQQFYGLSRSNESHLLSTFSGANRPTNRGLTGTDLKVDKVSKPVVLQGFDDDVVEDEYKKKDYPSLQKLPKPKTKKKTIIKIAALSTTKYDSSDEDDEPKKKKPKPASGKSGLSDLLPSPMNFVTKETNRVLVPHTLSKTKTAVAPKTIIRNVNTDIPTIPSTSRSNLLQNISDDEDDDISSSNFFSFNEPSQSQNIDNSVATVSSGTQNMLFDLNSSSDSFVGPAKPSGLSALKLPEPVSSSSSNYHIDAQYEVDDNEVENTIDSFEVEEEDDDDDDDEEKFLKDEEFLKMQGKKNRGNEAINIIDVHVDNQVDKLEMQRNLTEEAPRRSFSKKKNKDMPTTMQKRKHQIQYLAFQAKESEIELKNQWSNARNNKKQTQAKYGF